MAFSSCLPENGILPEMTARWCFFSSRRRHTRLQGDWSSDVCSSDLVVVDQLQEPAGADLGARHLRLHVSDDEVGRAAVVAQDLPDDVVTATFLLDLDPVELDRKSVV